MCFGGKKQRAPDPVPPPAPAPQPIAPSDVESARSEDERRQKLNRLRRGMASTIKTGAKGVAGSGSDLMQQLLSGKNKLGS